MLSCPCDAERVAALKTLSKLLTHADRIKLSSGLELSLVRQALCGATEEETGNVAAHDELDAARARFPVGEEVTGRVTRIPRPGTIGLLVDLGQEPQGFADVLHLPHDPDQWPPVGTVTAFEVLQHRPGQVRLFPLELRFCSPDHLPGTAALEDWSVIKGRFPVGSVVAATVTGVYPANREYGVRFEGCSATLEWTGDAPLAGATSRFVVTRHLDETRRIMLTPATTASEHKGPAENTTAPG